MTFLKLYQQRPTASDKKYQKKHLPGKILQSLLFKGARVLDITTMLWAGDGRRPFHSASVK